MTWTPAARNTSNWMQTSKSRNHINISRMWDTKQGHGLLQLVYRFYGLIINDTSIFYKIYRVDKEKEHKNQENHSYWHIKSKHIPLFFAKLQMSHCTSIARKKKKETKKENNKPKNKRENRRKKQHQRDYIWEAQYWGHKHYVFWYILLFIKKCGQQEIWQGIKIIPVMI